MMQRYVKWLASLTFLLLLAGAATAQQYYHQLTPNDFAGAVPAGSGFYVAHTSCNVTMRYNVQKVRSNYTLSFDIDLLLNPGRSWINRQMITNADMMAEVLRHEQGHYLIAYLMQQQLIKELNQYHYTGDYQRQANAIFTRIDDKYRQMNKDYDDDTQHMQNRKQQTAWINFLSRQLAQANKLAMNE